MGAMGVTDNAHRAHGALLRHEAAHLHRSGRFASLRIPRG